jgi:putative ABC transport system permease protein
VIQKLVWENVKHRPLRTFLSALLIGIPVTLVLSLSGLTKGMIDDNNKRIRGVGADIMIRPKDSNFMNLGTQGMNDKIVNMVRQQPHVKIATGILVHSLEGLFSSVAGIDLNEFIAMSGGLDYVAGGPFRHPDEVIIDQFYAKEHNKQVGSEINVLRQKMRVSGIVKPGKLNRVFMDLRGLQDLLSSRNGVNLIYVRVDKPQNINIVIDELKKQLVDYPVYSMDEATSLYSYDSVPVLRMFSNIVVGIAIFIGFAVVCLSMYMAVLQRTREIGILKSLGASRWYVMSIILREAVLLAIVGTILGIGMSFGARWAIQTFAPATFPPAIDPTWWPIAALIALIGAVLGALYPGMHAASMDPIEALSYE